MKFKDKTAVNPAIDILQNLEARFRSKYKLEIEYFRILRVDENYIRKLNRDLSFSKFFISFLFFIPIMVIHFIINILYVIWKPGKYVHLNESVLDFLFVSHATRANPSIFGDRIYGKLINTRKYSVSTVYFDHSNLLEKLTKSFCDRGTLLPKNLPIGTSIRHIISIYWDANRHYVNLVFKFKPDSKSKYFHRLELAAIYSQIKRRTISNFFIRKHFDFILQHSEVKNVVITYEGHAYEYIINNLCEVNDVNLCLYQHSPFSLGRFSMLNKKLINNNFVAFSSKIVRDWFVANDYLHKSHSFIVGTPKSSKPKFSQFELSEKKFILLAPEGVNPALKKYLSLARQLLKIGFVDVRLRVHPDMNLFYYHWCKLIIFRGRKGVDRSIDNLDSDLCRSKYCVFTSSSVGIESLTHNCQPIFFGTELENIYCNPLFICASRFDTFLKIEGIELKTIKLKAKKSFLYYDELKPDALYKMMI